MIKTTIAFVVTLFMIGCSGGESTTPSNSNNNSGGTSNTGSDTLTITKISDEKFEIKWIKEYTDFSDIQYYSVEGHGGIKILNTEKQVGTYDYVCNKANTGHNGYGDLIYFTCTESFNSQEVRNVAMSLQVGEEHIFGRVYHEGAEELPINADYIVTYHSDSTLTIE